ncbi:hypothetical protein N7E81_14610 [Reichenbachiella carrageenanivorans]|uniref:ADP-ribosylglycohydrolase n=1 Tax=Reichenbachiella carrageenanivorans TaxID=2979869 RepID=A0ABY6D401_9BACT|nr:hypothetical protein [Reichenbachiella carrageenanivorans]UXX78590.1 hypothetical protein N7E81_14610 [Reichenbachiella carrageenanivorans]
MEIIDTYLEDKSTYQFGREPLLIQSEFFNIKIQKAVENLGRKINLKSVLMVSAQVLSYNQFSNFFKDQHKMSVEDRKKFVENYYAHCGFGKLSMRGISNKGGHADLISDHYAAAWVKYYGQRPSSHPGVGYFTCGFLCGAIEAIFDVPSGTFDGKQSMCISKGESNSRFEIFRGLRRKLNPSPAFGKQQAIDESISENGLNNQKVVEAIRNLHVTGLASEKGLIEAFDTTWTKHYANYHSLIMIKLLMKADQKLGKGGVGHIKKIFKEGAERNAYFTLGKVLNSSFWKEKIAGLVDSDANSQWSACLAVMTGFGYGKWELTEGSSTEYKVNVINNPLTNAYLKLVGNTKAPLGYYTGGFLTGLANYIRQNPKPTDVDAEFVNEMVAAKGDVSYKEEQSRMTGSDKETLMILVH